MNAAQVLAPLRALLRDEDYHELRFSDSQLLETISQVQGDLVGEFGENVHVLRVVASEQMTLPYELAKIYAIKLDGRAIQKAQFERALWLEGVRFTHYGGKRYGVLGLSHGCNTGAGGSERTLEIWASCYPETLQEPSDDLELGERYARALALGSLCELLLIETNAANLQKLQFYRVEFERVKALLRAGKNRSLGAGVIETKAQW